MYLSYRGAGRVAVCRWAVADSSGENFLAGRKSDYRQPLADAGYAALVNAESQLLAALSKEIAAEIVALEK